MTKMAKLVMASLGQATPLVCVVPRPLPTITWALKLAPLDLEETLPLPRATQALALTAPRVLRLVGLRTRLLKAFRAAPALQAPLVARLLAIWLLVLSLDSLAQQLRRSALVLPALPPTLSLPSARPLPSVPLVVGVVVEVFGASLQASVLRRVSGASHPSNHSLKNPRASKSSRYTRGSSKQDSKAPRMKASCLE